MAFYPLSQLDLPRINSLFLLMLRSLFLALLYQALPIGLTLALALLTLVSLWRVLSVQFKAPPSPKEWLLHLGLDLFVLGYFFAFHGGLTHPYIALLLLPLIWAIYLLPWKSLSLFAGLFVLCLAYLYQQATFFQLTSQSPLEALQNHLTAQWLSHLLLLPAIGGFVLLIRWLDKRQQLENQHLKNQLAQQEQLTSLGLQAALSAHELATPLSTLDLISQDLQTQTQHHPLLQEDLLLMRQQIALCRQSLERLKRPQNQTHHQTLEDWWKTLENEWRIFFPQSRLRWPAVPPAVRQLTLLSSPLLEKAMINLLDNAWRSHDQLFEIEWKASANRLSLMIRNDKAAQIQPGLGIGLPLALATFETHQVNLRCKETDQRFETCVEWPLANCPKIENPKK
jgi:two-component system sensor histidine kinase RegB